MSRLRTFLEWTVIIVITFIIIGFLAFSFLPEQVRMLPHPPDSRKAMAAFSRIRSPQPGVHKKRG